MSHRHLPEGIGRALEAKLELVQEKPGLHFSGVGENTSQGKPHCTLVSPQPVFQEVLRTTTPSFDGQNHEEQERWLNNIEYAQEHSKVSPPVSPSPPFWQRNWYCFADSLWAFESDSEAANSPKCFTMVLMSLAGLFQLECEGLGSLYLLDLSGPWGYKQEQFSVHLWHLLTKFIVVQCVSFCNPSNPLHSAPWNKISGNAVCGP